MPSEWEGDEYSMLMVSIAVFWDLHAQHFIHGANTLGTAGVRGVKIQTVKTKSVWKKLLSIYEQVNMQIYIYDNFKCHNNKSAMF